MSWFLTQTTYRVYRLNGTLPKVLRPSKRVLNRHDHHRLRLFPKKVRRGLGVGKRGERRKGRERERWRGLLTFWMVNGRPISGEEAGQIGLPLVLMTVTFR